MEQWHNLSTETQSTDVSALPSGFIIIVILAILQCDYYISLMYNKISVSIYNSYV